MCELFENIFLVKQLNGLARLQFTRIPFTHWSLSFEEEPNIDLQLESEIQGRQMQSATNLIVTAIKKAIRRKHTLPYYKLRFKPFFKKLVFDEIEMSIERSGNLEVNLINLTRLNYSSQLKQVYATLTLSSQTWIHASQIDDENLSVNMDIEIHKAKNQQIGIVFKQTDRVLVESILPNTPAKKSLLKSGDILLSIEGRKVVTLNQVAKILKSITKTVIRLRIERIVKGYIKNDGIVDDDLDVQEDLLSMNISFSKKSDTVSIKSDNKSSDSETIQKSISSTPRNSPKKLHERNVEHRKAVFPQHSTIDCLLTDFIRINDSTKFALNNEMKYLNISVHGRSTSDDNTLLGYINIPVDNILAECGENNLEYMEKFILHPPEVTEMSNTNLSQMSGFCPDICYGDILLNFKWDQASLTKDRKEQKNSNFSSQEDDGEELKKHNFIRTHFSRSTQCDFCGKKIWLKDAVQCKDCQMTCHKKCMMRSQSSTVCYGTMDQNELLTLKVTDTDCQDDDEVADEALESYRGSSGEHRKSFSDMLAHGIKRVNSANSLNIPMIVSSLSTNSKSLPPTPQHFSRKPSLTNIINVNNPFVTIVQRLEDVPSDKTTMTQEEIEKIIAPIDQNMKNLDDLMELAKSSSESLYAEFDMEERVKKINDLVNIFFFQFYCKYFIIDILTGIPPLSLRSFELHWTVLLCKNPTIQRRKSQMIELKKNFSY